MILHAPWTEVQVEALRRRQAEGLFHPYTCREHSDVALTPTPAGWRCRHCDYYQQWVRVEDTITPSLPPPGPPPARG